MPAPATGTKPAVPPPAPVRAAKPTATTAPLPAAVVLPPPNVSGNSSSSGSAPLQREPARDTLAPSSFGVLGGPKHATAPAPAPMRGARAPLPTLGELEGATATATLRPPGAVPPPPRALPMPTPALDAGGPDRGSALETPLPGGELPFTPLAGDLPPSPRTPQPRVDPAPRENATLLSSAASRFQAKGDAEVSLESTLDMNGSASKKATQAALIEQTRISEGAGAKSPAAAAATGTVPAPGLFIADEPLEPRPRQPSLVTAQRELLTRMRLTVLILGGLLLMAAGALVVLAFRRSEAHNARATAASASALAALPPTCTLSAPPSRISTIERSVPISALAQADGTIALAVADTKSTAAGWIYDPAVGEAKRRLDSPPGVGDVSHVTATEPLVVDRANPEFAFAQTLTPGLALGVGPTGLLRRGDDGATGVVWPLNAGVRVTPPRVASTPKGYFAAFREGGAEGRISTLWLGSNGGAAGPAAAVQGAPKSLGTPNVAMLGEQGLVLFSARGDKAEPYRVYAAIAAPGQAPGVVRALDLPSEGGGAIAPSIAALPRDRYLVQWTDGNVGQYQVHVRILDNALQPAGDALLVSGKGANAGQGTIVSTAHAAVSFFIQTTAGHDELWGATLSCH
ncbi:MAG TPA: hypothetical protein VHP33_22975 [Polyangiaceae bacterium]|nr:hypothetical protein [Polyangiaceae bacterium]